MPDLNEKILFSRLKEQDHKAFAHAYDKYVDQIYRFVYFKVGNKEEAEDITSAIFLKTWNYLNEKGKQTKEEFKSLKPLFYRVARNAVIDHYRKNGNKGSVSIETIENPKDHQQDPHKQAEIASDMSMIEGKLSELKEEYREIIVLRYVQELSVNEIADILEKSKGNVRVISYRALKALKELIEEHER